jgi:hypothetical protein
MGCSKIREKTLRIKLKKIPFSDSLAVLKIEKKFAKLPHWPMMPHQHLL